MKYKDSIPVTSYIWIHYFKQFHVSFIDANLQFKYMAVYDCIDTFKAHPGGISWHTIDKYMSSRIGEFRRNLGMLTISDTVTDLPCWFVKKHIDILSIKCHNVNAHFNYKFISRHVANINMIHINMIKIRTQYVTMLTDIIGVPSTLNSKPTPGGRRIDVTSVPLHWAYNPVHTVCKMSGVVPDLYDTVSGYC